MSDDDLGTVAIMAATGKSWICVWRWRERFMREGVDGLLRERTRPPGIPGTADEKVAEVIRLTREPPPHEATQWTVRAMGAAVGLAASTVRAIWKAHGLSPHRWRQFKLSNDPAFAEKLQDVVGLYVAPPAHAVALSVDEKNQISAPKQRSTEGEEQDVKAGRIPEGWKNDPAKLHQKDMDARWTVQFGKARAREDGKPQPDIAIPTFGYKAHTSIDRRYRFIRRWDVTDASRHDGRMLRRGLLDKSNTGGIVRADSAYRSKQTRNSLIATASRPASITASPKASRWRLISGTETPQGRSTEPRSNTSSPTRNRRWAWSSEPSASPAPKRRSGSSTSSTTCTGWSRSGGPG